jgi:hypothetical protein
MWGVRSKSGLFPKNRPQEVGLARNATALGFQPRRPHPKKVPVPGPGSLGRLFLAACFGFCLTKESRGPDATAGLAAFDFGSFSAPISQLAQEISSHRDYRDSLIDLTDKNFEPS